ncbi:uncharacterized protein BDV17DRAFT_282123 [Aspergillus undulatus]|uniref:uncharacterized protein n=1 Tax=Aspergillus undulatus TaxID=1810928 RepID=UPI003CCD6B65
MTFLSVNLYYNLGSFGHTITTTSANTQTWFNRALTWVYLFNHVKGAYWHQAAQCALKFTKDAIPLERALIKPAKDYPVVNQAYTDAMKPVYKAFGDKDLDAAALYTNALINITPWALWDLFMAKPNPKASTMEVKAVLEDMLAREDNNMHLNPGLLYFYIHFIKILLTPELGINTADYLRDLVPNAGHIHYMPMHLDILTTNITTAAPQRQQG